MRKLWNLGVYGFAIWGVILTILMVLAVSGAWHFFHAHFGH